MKKSELKQLIKEEMEKMVNKPTISVTKDELQTFMDDVSKGDGAWSDTSYKLLRFLGIEPTDGI